jgi:hypothetical protein
VRAYIEEVRTLTASDEDARRAVDLLTVLFEDQELAHQKDASSFP